MNLKEFFRENNKVAIAFSGGTDSAFLLYAAAEYGAEATAYYVKSQFQPAFELEDAVKISELTGIKMKILEFNILTDEIASNPPDRCYYCKHRIMSAVTDAALEDGYSLIIDGTNASDDAGDRPGMKALGELGIRSPLRECGITKDEVRRQSRMAGLPTWDKPAYACLATRIGEGEWITKEKLERTERAEEFMKGLGFTDFRVRTRGEGALVQVKADQYDMARSLMNEIKSGLSDYDSVSLDSVIR